MSDWTEAPLGDVRRVIAATILDAPTGERVSSRLGQIVLRPHQHAAADRLVALVTTNGGALLAEPVGVGKTYTALAAAARLGGSLLVAAPSALIDMWRVSLSACGMSADVVSHEALSRGTVPRAPADLIIVDESHRLRSPSTRRYATLASLAVRARLLLVSATPVQNRRADLASQLALYIGRSAWQLTDEQLAAHVVRQSSDHTTGRPRLNGPHVVPLACDDDCLDRIVGLPPPVPARNESVAAALLTYGLVHQWTSSRAALLKALQRRRARGLALLAAIDAGREPTRAELSAWSFEAGAVQLAFPELVTTASLDVERGASLRTVVAHHADAVHDLFVHLSQTQDPDVVRAAALRGLRAQHPGERIIAFCQYTETVNSLRGHMSRDAGIAALTATGARVAGGRISRRDVLRQFIPSARGGQSAPAAERIDLLLTTDLLAEGLNLQEASVIVHLDLPWNPARLDQRVGRALRLGSRHQTVSVYSLAPPASAERLLGIERRLRDKLAVAQRTIGVAGQILPSVIAQPATGSGIAEDVSAVLADLNRWRGATDLPMPHATTLATSAVASHAGFLALVHHDGQHRLVAGLGAGITTAPPDVRRAVLDASGDTAALDHTQLNASLTRLSRWLTARAAESTIDLHAAASARSRRAALTRVARALARVPRHQRANIVPLAAAARAVATAPLAEGAERILETLVAADLPDDAWLRSIAAFGELNARPRGTVVSTTTRDRVLAIIVFAPPVATLQSST